MAGQTTRMTRVITKNNPEVSNEKRVTKKARGIQRVQGLYETYWGGCLSSGMLHSARGASTL